MTDIVLVNVPGTLTNKPLMAPALLKASLEKEGFTCKTIDFNARFYSEVNDSALHELEKYFIGPDIDVTDSAHSLAENIISLYATEILQYNPNFVGISVFTYQSRVAAKLLSIELKKHSDSKIILGGQGIIDGGILGKSGFGQTLLESNLIDYYIRSEGESSLVELLKGNTAYPGINSNSFKQIDNLDLLPWANYDDYDFSLYTKKSIPMLSSRGCVRSCSFCDIHSHWKYRYRSGNDVANEMIFQAQKYNIEDFVFGDSLINGNLKEFKKFIEILSTYNKTAEKKLKWSSQFIVRNQQQLNESYWENLAASGAYNLAIGIETGSDKVREHMNKKFTNDDIDYTLGMFEKYGITCVFLIITGYPTETKLDFQETINMFTKYKQYSNTVITSVTPGSGLGILSGTPLFEHAAEENIQLDKIETNWIAWNNLDLTVDEKIHRRQFLVDHLRKLGYNVSITDNAAFTMMLDKKDYYKKRQHIMIKIKKENNNGSRSEI